MNRLSTFYLLLSLYFVPFVIAARLHFLTSLTFFVLLLIYAVLYHPLISGLRLLANHKIESSEFWKTFIPGWNKKYWLFLMFNVK